MDKVSELHRPINFTIDSRSCSTADHKQLAADLLRLGGLPAYFDLGESRCREAPESMLMLADKHSAARPCRQRAQLASPRMDGQNKRGSLRDTKSTPSVAIP